MSPVLQKFRHDISGILWLGIACFLALALYSFNPGDPSFNSTGHSLKVANYCGYFGSFLSDLLFQCFGVVSWVLVAGAARLSYLAFRGEEISFKNWRLLWASLLVFTLSSLLSLYLPETYFFNDQVFVGGLLGLVVSQGLVAVFNKLGVAVILWSFAVILLIFYTERSLGEFLQLPRKYFLIGKDKVIALFSSLREEITRKLELLRSRGRESDLALAGGSLNIEDGLRKSSLEKIASGAPKEPSMLYKKTLNVLKKFKRDVSEIEPDETNTVAEDVVASEHSDIPSTFIPIQTEPEEEEEEVAPTRKRRVKMAAKVQRKIANWELPKIDMLDDPPLNRIRIDEAEIEAKAEILVDKLAQFSVGGQIVGVKTGPAVTMFEFRPNADVKISKIIDLADDLSLALSAESVRIIAPIPGRDVVGIETSNDQRETVYLKDIVAEKSFWDEEKAKLPIPLGRQADGRPKVVDLRKMPHAMVAGTTGSGKSVFVVSTLVSLLFRHSPKTLKLILVDPKQVDLAAFSRVPHLLMPPIREPKKAVSALRWAINEMEKRYRSMSKFGARGLEAFNEIVEGLDRLDFEKHEEMNQMMEEDGHRNEMYYYTPQPYIVIVVEEFGDLMAVDKGNVEQAVVRLAQMARACGIHLILAMQSPRKDVVTGLIKTNIPGRLSFKVASKMDSRIILDEAGAERLLAQGDMLYVAPGVQKPARHHGPWLTDAEIDSVMNFWAKQGEPEYDELAMRALEGNGGGVDLNGDAGGGGDDEYDERYDEVLSWVSSQKAVSASLLQRKFRLGYPRAARIIEVFESEGVVGPANGSKPRQVLVGSYAEQ